jgi:hypothetical protein
MIKKLAILAALLTAPCAAQFAGTWELPFDHRVATGT